MSEELLALFRATGALLDGHFVLRSGLHSRQFFQCALLLQHTEIATEVCSQLAAKLRGITADAVLSPALGGIIVGQEVALLRGGFKISPNENFVVAEDVVTRGARVREAIDRGAYYLFVSRAHSRLLCSEDRSGESAPLRITGPAPKPDRQTRSYPRGNSLWQCLAA